jgi:cytochrome b subunit of formate dehydrogenase
MNGERIRRFTRRHAIHHWVMMVTFIGLVITGMPQRYPGQEWAKGVILIIGGVERTRWLHHFLGTIMSLQLVWHLVESLWIHQVRRLPMAMMPRMLDVRHFVHQVRFNLGLLKEPPRMDRYTFAEKIEYLALVWGTALMVITGLVLLFPVRFSAFVSGEVILAAKAAHGGEAILALLSILTWHVYFVHVRHWNTSIFNGHLEVDAYAEEHPLELETIRRGEQAVPAPATARRLAVFAFLAFLTVGATVAITAWLWSGGPQVVTIAPR